MHMKIIGIFRNWSAFSSFYNKITLLIYSNSRIKQAWNFEVIRGSFFWKRVMSTKLDIDVIIVKDTIFLDNIASIFDNHWVIATDSSRLTILIY
jgi:hypothetical protein